MASSLCRSSIRAGLMEGKNTTKMIFDFNGKITVQEMAKVLVTAQNSKSQQKLTTTLLTGLKVMFKRQSTLVW